MGRGASLRPGPPLVIVLGLLAYALCAIGSGLDRMVVGNPSSEQVVPGPFRARAAIAASAIAFDRKDYQAALALAHLAVNREPVDNHALGNLGAARLMTGDEAGAERAFVVAGATGWRDLPTQLYWYQRAMQAGDLKVASQRLDAILRVNVNWPPAALLLRPLEATPAGRAALADRLVARPGWIHQYVGTAQSQDLPNRADVVSRMSMPEGRIGCHFAAVTARRLLDDGYRAPAERAWRLHCPELPISRGLADPDFRALANVTTGYPFGWRRHPTGDVSVSLTGLGGGRHGLAISNRSPAFAPFLTQAVELAPGRYRVRLNASDPARVPPKVFSAALSCKGTIERPASGAGTDITVKQCPRQLLSLWIAPGTPELVIGSISLDPIEPAAP